MFAWCPALHDRVIRGNITITATTKHYRHVMLHDMLHNGVDIKC